MFLFVIWHQSIQSKVPQGVVADRVTVWDEMNSKRNVDNQLFGRQVTHCRGTWCSENTTAPGLLWVNMKQSFTSSLPFHTIFKWHQSIHARIPQGVVVYLKPVWDKTSNKLNSKSQFFRWQADSEGGLLRGEFNCPIISLSEHEARLHFLTLRAIPGYLRVSSWTSRQSKTNLITKQIPKSVFWSPGKVFSRWPAAARILLPGDCSEWAWSRASRRAASELST